MGKLSLLLLLAGILVLWPRPAAAQDVTFERWVQPGGDDTKQCIRITVPPEDDEDETTYDYADACATIARALEVAQPGDIIRVASGAYGAPLVVAKSVTIIGGYAPGFGSQIEPPTYPDIFPVLITGVPGITNLSIRGQALIPLDPSLSGEGPMQVTIKDVRVQGGGGISIFSGASGIFPANRVDITLEGVVVQSNSGTSPGGGIDISGTGNKVRIIKSTITGNSTPGDGGGIYVGSGAQLTLDDKTRVQNNTASGNGGGLAAVNALTGTVSGGITMTGNLAANGGGVYIANSPVTVGSDTVIQNNSASNSGGGVYLNGGSPSVSSAIIRDNNASVSGGGIYATDGSPLLENLTVSLNEAPSGGGVYLNGLTKGQLRSSRLLTNTATSGAGGGYYVSGGNTISVTSNIVQANEAQTHGGGGYVTGGSGSFGGNSYFGNSANLGGGLYVTSSGNQVSLAGESFDLNTASSGGGVYLTNNNGANFSGLALSENNADSGGGLYATGNTLVNLGQPEFIANTGSNGAGFYTVSSTLVFTGASLFQGNIATGNGGAGYLGSNGVVTFATLDLLSNEAANGAGIYSSGGRANVIQAGSYIGNKASGDGGVFYFTNTGGVAATLLDTFAQDNEAAHGGAIYANGVTLTVGDLELQGNEAGNGSGGGIALDSVTLTVNGTATLIGNTASVNGGGISAVNSTLTFTQGVQLQGNKAQGGDGGGIYATASSPLGIDLKIATVSENVASSDGGGVYAHNVNLTVAPTSSFKGNTAQTGNGGGLYVSGRPLTLNNVKLEENIAMLLGGGGYLSGATGLFTNGTLLRANQALGGSGGGFAVANSTSFVISDTVLVDNVAGSDGGGVHTSATNIIVQGGASITGNKATNGRGGALFTTGSNISLAGITLSTNQAGSGGGALYLTGGGVVTLVGNSLSQNNGGSGPGGGVYLQVTTANLTSNTIQQNQAGSGGGLYLENTPNAAATGGVILDNVATGAGGGLYATGTQLALTNGDLRSNQAGGEGGGAYFIYSRVGMTNTLVARNRLAATTTYGAGILAANTVLNGIHITLADNSHLSDQGIPHGLYAPAPVAPPSTNVTLVNSIVSGPGVGLNLLAGNSANLNTVLWNNARFDWTGAAVFAVVGSKRGDPRYVAAASGDYRLRRDSAAFDQGIATTLLVDRNGVVRPQSLAPDLGAHEQSYSAGLYLTTALSPTFVKLGDTITINVRVRNQSAETATNVGLSLVLPPQLPAPTISQGSCQGGFCTVPLGNLPVGADVTIQVSVGVAGTPSAAGLVNLLTNISLIAPNFTTSDTAASVRAYLHSCRAARGATIYTTVQSAVDAAAAGETIRISGACGDFHQTGGPGQLVTLNKNVTLQGGWNGDFTLYDPVAFPAYLDAGGAGRVVFLPNGVSPTLQTIVLRNGNAAGLSGGPAGKDAGGGIYINNSTPILQNVDIAGNSSPDLGGGVYLAGALPTFTGGFIRNNVAGERGGGIYVDQVAPTLSGVAITGNSARAGGGAYLDRANAQFLDTAAPGAAPTCRIDLNTTTGSPNYQPGPGAGGLPVLWLAPGGGGGLALDRSAATVRGCSVNGNTARSGGGIYVHNSAATLENSQITANRAQLGTPVLVGPGGVSDGDGGGLLIDNTNPATLIVRGLLLGLNTGTRGSALFTRLAQSGTLALPHLTINSNSGGAAVVALGQSALAFNDTIIAFNTDGPATFAQNGSSGQTATISLLRTLWHPTTQTRTGSAAGGSVATSTDFTGDPAFRNDGYHLKRISFAYGVGAATANFADRDGHTRPIGTNAELGADEYPNAVTVRYVAVGGPGGAPCTDFQNPCPALQIALDAAADGDLIKMAGGNYAGVVNNGGTVQHARIAKSVTIQGGYFPRTDNNTVTDGDYTINDWEDPHPAENPTIINVADQGRIFYIAGNVTPALAFLTLRRGNATAFGGGPPGSSGGAGGAIYVDGAAPTFESVIVEESRAHFGSAFYLRNAGGLYTGLTVTGNGAGVTLARGGGFYIEGGSPTLQNLTIQNNVAITGAGVFLDNSAATLVQNSLLANGNDTTLAGGGLYVLGGAPTIITNTINLNRSRHGGGARLDNTNALMRGNSFSGNRAGASPTPVGQADARGAGLYISGGAPQILNNQFANNIATHATIAYGGGVYLGPSAALISGNTWSGNQAHRGAGLYAAGGGGASVDGNTFSANLAQAPNADLRPAGGGIFMASAAISVTHNTFAQNEAQFGGGLYLLGSGGYVYSNTVVNNRAEQDGGGFYLDGSNAQVRANLIEANRTTQGNGGGLLARNGQAIVLENAIRDNLATLGGGGVYLHDDGSTLTQQLIQGNQSADGGGIYVNGPLPGATQSPPLLDALELRDNIATNHGGGLLAVNSGLSLRRSRLHNNQAAVDGGGVYLVGTAPANFSANLIAQNSAGDGGGGIFVGRGTTGRYASNAVIQNQAGQGGGILVEGAAPVFVHTTLANNGTGLVVVAGGPMAASAVFTNTVVANHTLGVQANDGASAALFQTLWDGNGTKFAGPGTVSSTGDIDGAAAFEADGYHVQPTSAAVGRGLTGDVAQGSDIDGEGRFQGNGPELGADELGAPCAAILAGIPNTVYASVQQAVDAAPNNGEVRVAGTCAGVINRAGGNQVIYFNKNVTVRGGYIPSDWETAAPTTRPTILDARKQGRVVRVGSGVIVKLEGLTLLNGAAAGQGGGPNATDAGGALYADGAQVTLDRLIILNSQAQVGGGIYLQATTATLANSELRNNFATEQGGALYLLNAPASVEVRANQFRSNLARDGGAVYIVGGSPLLQSNQFYANQALGTSGQSNSGRGGGLFVETSRASLNRNRLEGNRADLGGALYIVGGPPNPTNNLFIGNIGTLDAAALYSVDAALHLRHNTLSANDTVRSGGSAILFAQPSANTPVSLTNNIVVNHSLAISVSTNTNLNVRANLWFNNTGNWAGPGTVVEGAANVTVDPGFVSAATGDYQLRADSAAIDSGINIGVFDDLTGQPRPARQGFDIGADEYLLPSLNVALVALPDPVAAGGQQAYIVQVFNTGDVNLVATVRLSLPAPLSPLGPIEWRDVAIARGAIWDGEVTAAVAEGYTGPLVASVQVSSDQGATANAQVTSEAATISAEILGFAGESLPNPATPGTPVELRIRLTNAGGIPLHTRIEATLPPGLTTSGPTVFTPTITGPGGALSTQINALLGTEVMAGTGAHANALYTTFDVTSDQGLGGTYTITTVIARPGITLRRTPTPQPAVSGATLAYQVAVTNTGNVAMVATISNTFPAQVALNSLADAQPWQVTLAPGEVYLRSVSTTVEAGYIGPLLGSVRATTDVGVSATAQDDITSAPLNLSPTATAKGGDWYRADSWEPAGVPPVTAIVAIPEGVTLFSTRPIVVARLVNRGVLELRNPVVASQTLSVTGALENYGEILGEDSTRSGQPGLALSLNIGTLYNTGIICAGDGAIDGGAGGDLSIVAGASTNLGLLCGGRGADVLNADSALAGGRGGDVYLTFNPGLFVNRGQVLAGDGGNSHPNADPPQPGGAGGDITIIATAAARLGDSDVKAGTGGQGSNGAAQGTIGNVVVGAPEIIAEATRFSQGPVALLGLEDTAVNFTALAPVGVTVSLETGIANFVVRVFNRSGQADSFVAVPQATPSGWSVNNLPATLGLQAFRSNVLPVTLTIPVNQPGGVVEQPFAIVITSQRNAGIQIILPLNIVFVEDGNYQLRLPNVHQ